MRKPTETVLIRFPNWIGDVVMATAGLEHLKLSWLDSRLIAVAKPWVYDVLKNHPALENIIIHNPRSFPLRSLDFFQTVKKLKNIDADRGVLFHKNFESAFLFAMAGIPERWGRPTDGRGFLLTERIHLNSETLTGHQVFHYVRIAESVTGTSAEDLKPRVFLNPEDRTAALEILKQKSGNGPIIPIAAGAAYGTAKCWPAHKVARLIREMYQKWDARVFLLGGHAERETACQIADESGAPVSIIAGDASILIQSAIIEFAGLCIANDSGLMHVAAALDDVRVVAVFGPTKPQETAPFGQGHIIHHAPVDCWPCKHRTCPIDHKCMEQINVEAVFNSVESIISSR